MNLKKLFFLLPLLACITLSGCKKTTDTVNEIKDKIIKAYWKNADDLVMEVGESEGTVVDFGRSKMGSNRGIFDGKKQPLLRNIVRTGSSTWKAEAAKGTYDASGKLTAISYVETTLTSTTNNGKETITLTGLDPDFEKWTKELNYTPPPVLITCDTVKNKTTGNSFQLTNFWRGDLTFSDAEATSSYYLPLNRTVNTPCHYRVEGNAVLNNIEYKVIALFGSKPSASQTYTTETSSYGSIVPLGEGKVSISLDGVYYPAKSTDVVTVTVSGNQITVEANNIELTSLSNGDCNVTCRLVGQ